MYVLRNILLHLKRQNNLLNVNSLTNRQFYSFTFGDDKSALVSIPFFISWKSISLEKQSHIKMEEKSTYLPITCVLSSKVILIRKIKKSEKQTSKSSCKKSLSLGKKKSHYRATSCFALSGF